MLAWLWLVVRTVRKTIARGSVGLPAAMLMSMTFLYGGAFVYAVPGYTHLRPGGHWYLEQYDFSEIMIVQATLAALLGVFAFAIGAGAFSPTPKVAQAQAPRRSTPTVYNTTALKVMGWVAIVSFLLHFMGVSFPLSNALLETGRNTGVAGICLGMFFAAQNSQATTKWIILATLVPIYYIVGFGFASYGFLFGTVLVAFHMAQVRKVDRLASKLTGMLWILGIIYSILTALVVWLSFRDRVRAIVWENRGGSLGDVLLRALSEVELFSLWNFDALDLVNIRLNLGIFVGRMMELHASDPELQMWGSSLFILPFVLVPRFLWPGKPSRGGSDFMSDHTGMTLSESTTFGSGSVFEYYANFGYIGIFVCFLITGWMIAKLDRSAARHLYRGRYLHFARLYVMGLVAVDPLLRPFFVVNGIAFAWIFMTALKFAVQGMLNRKRLRV